jgi:hypothetical protein
LYYSDGNGSCTLNFRSTENVTGLCGSGYWWGCVTAKNITAYFSSVNSLGQKCGTLQTKDVTYMIRFDSSYKLTRVIVPEGDWSLACDPTVLKWCPGWASVCDVSYLDDPFFKGATWISGSPTTDPCLYDITAFNPLYSQWVGASWPNYPFYPGQCYQYLFTDATVTA